MGGRRAASAWLLTPRRRRCRHLVEYADAVMIRLSSDSLGAFVLARIGTARANQERLHVNARSGACAREWPPCIVIRFSQNRSCLAR
jgi:hypothetical protein